MKKLSPKLLVSLGFVCLVLIFSFWRGTRDMFEESLVERPGEEAQEEKGFKPSDWFFAQRAYPYGEVNLAAYREAVFQAIRSRERNPENPGEVVWSQAGPTNIGGRITDLAVDPRDRNVIYAGAASGGVLKSTDGGGSWSALFDSQPTLSIGALAIDPLNPEVLYVGTGEANAGGGSVTYGGFGVFKTTDGGDTWENVGLEETRYIGRIRVDPSDPDRVFVAAVGTLFSTNSDRGVYRTTNGGTTWQHVLSVSDSTGAVDIIQNPYDTNVLYAAMWERIRRPGSRSYGGITSGVYRTTNGGDSWSLLTNGLPHSSPDVGRIGLALSEADPSILYAIFADDVGYFMGLYRSDDAGGSWSRVNDGALQSGSFYYSYGWWFGFIAADPTNPDILFAHGVGMYKTTNGGDSWNQIAYSNHVDHHAQYIDPADHNWTVEGNDGGIYISTNGGSSWTKSYDLPITQFYTNEIDFLDPVGLAGGAQDNGTLRTLDGAIDEWDEIYGGDGFYVIIDPTDSDIIYAESQYGGLGKSTNGGYSWISAQNGINGGDRRNWSTPVVMDPSNHNTLYYGTYRVYRTTNGAQSWSSISGDLTNGPMGGNLVYNTVTTIAVAPSNPQVVYAGSDDGRVHVTFNGGQSWQDITGSLPERWVTRVVVDPQNHMKAYVTISGFRWDSPLPHVFATSNGGTSWSDISADLPEIPVNDLVVDPQRTSILYVATDLGVYVSTNAGTTWEDFNAGLPMVPVTDLTFHPPTRKLSAATYGRSMFTVTLPPSSVIIQKHKVLVPWPPQENKDVRDDG